MVLISMVEHPSFLEEIMKLSVLPLIVLMGASVGGAATLTVGPHSKYTNVCSALIAAADGDTVLIDANHEIPYIAPPNPQHSDGRADCEFKQNNLTIAGINGRPILDAGTGYIEKGIFVIDGHDVVIDNLEFRNANAIANPKSSTNAAGIRIQDGFIAGGAPPAGGNITIQRCYIHDNGMGILGANAGANDGGAWFPANPFIMMQYDEFDRNGVGGNGLEHNIYMGYGGNLTYTLQYSWSNSDLLGLEVKSRAPINNLLYNLISDPVGTDSFDIELPQGGTTYIVGNVIEKGPTCAACNTAMIMWRTQDADTFTGDPDYGPPNEDLHFINNTVIDDSTNNFPSQFVSTFCYNTVSSTCPAAPPDTGSPLVVPPVFENNIFLGPAQSNGEPDNLINDGSAITENNILLVNTPANLASLHFADPAGLDFRLLGGSPAIGEGIYPPTNANGVADPQSVAVDEYSDPVGFTPRRRPTGSTMDAGAFAFAPQEERPHLEVHYSHSVSSPGTGTISVFGLGQQNNDEGNYSRLGFPGQRQNPYHIAAFLSGNTNVIGEIPTVESLTGNVEATFTVLPVNTRTVVPIYIFANGEYMTIYVTVQPASSAAAPATN